MLTLLLGIKKGDIYNIDILNKKLGKNSARKAAISVHFIWMMDICSSRSIRWKQPYIMIPSIMKSGLVEGPQATY